MTVLQRGTDLTTSQKIECAAAALAGQHAHGSKTALSEVYEISRPTGCMPRGRRRSRCTRAHFDRPLLQGAAVDVRVDDAQLRRALVALRVLAANAIRSIEDLLNAALSRGEGLVRDDSAEVGARPRVRRRDSTRRLRSARLKSGALDEMFMPGRGSVLAGVDLDSGYLFCLTLSAARDGGAWAELLREGQGQGLELSVVVKAAAKGIADGGERRCSRTPSNAMIVFMRSTR